MKSFIITSAGGRRPSRPVIHRTVKQVVVVHQQSTRLPDFMTRLSCFCDGDKGRNHPLPVAAEFKGPELTPRGQLVAGYRCRCCGTKFLWAVHGQTGRPTLIYAGK
jgi:hypothetical protein